MSSARTFLASLRDTVRLPLFDLNYLTSTEAFDLYTINPTFPRRGLLGCTAVFCAKLLQHTIRWRPIPKNAIAPGSILVATETKNQYDALLPVQRRLENSVLVNLEAQPGTPFPTGPAYLASLLFWPLLLLRYFEGSPYQRGSYAHVLHHYWLTYGFYLVARSWLRRLRPSLVFVANDHNMKTRTLTRAARDEGIPTAYIQHASISEKFPPLAFDLAFLDGDDALDKYAAKGASRTKVFLAGIPKLDAYVGSRNRHPALDTLGVCINVLDPTERVVSLCTGLLRHFPGLPITLRPHPGDPRAWPALLPQPGIAHSDSRIEAAFAFLGKVDAIVAGDSNISLEALLMNVTPLYYDFSSQGRDNYGFVRRGAVAYFREESDLYQVISALRPQRPDVLHHAEPYCATVGTSFDGASAQLVATTLTHHLEGATDLPEWLPHPAGPLEAYRPSSGKGSSRSAHAEAGALP